MIPLCGRLYILTASIFDRILRTPTLMAYSKASWTRFKPAEKWAPYSCLQ